VLQKAEIPRPLRPCSVQQGENPSRPNRGGLHSLWPPNPYVSLLMDSVRKRGPTVQSLQTSANSDFSSDFRILEMHKFHYMAV
jgi:hypothetical protein